MKKQHAKMGLFALAANEGPHLRVRAVESASYSVHLEICWKLLKKKKIATPDQTVLTVTCANSMSI